MIDVDEFLEHRGVKGMKWGVRRNRTQKETKVRTKRAKISKNRRTLPDAEVKKYIERLSNEKKLKELIDNDLKPGRSVAKKIMSESGQKVARTVVAGAALYGVKAAMDKKFNLKEAAGYVAPKPKNK